MSVKIVECPRDAMQGLEHFIPTPKKIEYLNSLIEVGFDFIDCGSFVSARAVPQLADTSEVLNSINPIQNGTQLLAIIANEKGAETACSFNNLSTIGFPMSVSETFQLRNTRQTTREAFERLYTIKKIADDAGKQFLVYLSMGFGNPYQDEWSTQITLDWCHKVADIGVKMINLSDTIGVANPDNIASLFQSVSNIKQVEFGAHFHTKPDNYLENISAAYQNGCRKFDAAMKGFGGCPFAADKLTGNLPTEKLIQYLDSISESTNIIGNNFSKSFQLADYVFS